MSDTGIRELDGYLPGLLDQWQTPGLAVVVLKDNKIILSKGYGYRNINNQLEMTSHTIQPIASCTKAFTSTAIAMLADRSCIKWDTPVQKFVPRFQLKDPFVSNRVTVVDILSHRTGLPRHDFVWLDSGFTYDQVLDRLPHLPLSRDLRTAYQYCNLMYMAASVIIEELSGMSYSQFVTQHIFEPVGMSDSNCSLTDMRNTPDFATPYKERDCNLVECVLEKNDVAGAGCINASIDDMGKWLQLHLNEGEINNTRIVSSDNVKRTHQPVVMISTGSDLDVWVPGQKWIRFQAYALGWINEMYRGHRAVSHEGGIDGSSSRMSFLPDEGIAVGVIVNKSDSFFPMLVTYYVLDRLLGLEVVDWNGLLKPLDDESKKISRESGAKFEELRILNTVPSHPLQDYTGTYYNPGYGQIEIHEKEKYLQAILGGDTCPLTHYHFDTFQFEYRRFDWKELLTFQVDAAGEIVGFTIKLEALVPPLLFERLPDNHMRDSKFLKAFVGKYEMAGIPVEIAFKGEDIITFRLPGQAAKEMVPIRGLRFKLKDSEAANITFKEDAPGQVSAFLFSQFGEVIPGKRING